tara:strand:- start:3891 stop:4397 length:507 start_codon:yes stop_codon:yes gene_type:complete
MSTKYRFSYSPKFHTLLNHFATIHRFDRDRKQFKESWEQWLKDNKTEVDAEIAILHNNGFKGSPLNKMYKSVRYYYRNKPFMTKNDKHRSIYISLDPVLISNINKHCRKMVGQKPENAFQEFIRLEDYDSWKNIEKNRLNMNDQDIHRKIQKIYKNHLYKIKSNQCVK